jgi:mannosyltransferase OCH1-like enzyme
LLVLVLEIGLVRSIESLAVVEKWLEETIQRISTNFVLQRRPGGDIVSEYTENFTGRAVVQISVQFFQST